MRRPRGVSDFNGLFGLQFHRVTSPDTPVGSRLSSSNSHLSPRSPCVPFIGRVSSTGPTGSPNKKDCTQVLVEEPRPGQDPRATTQVILRDRSSSKKGRPFYQQTPETKTEKRTLRGRSLIQGFKTLYLEEIKVGTPKSKVGSTGLPRL